MIVLRGGILVRSRGCAQSKHGLSCPANAGHPVMMVWRLLDRPPEPVIGPARGRTRWRAMTSENAVVLVDEIDADGVVLAPDDAGVVRQLPHQNLHLAGRRRVV